MTDETRGLSQGKPKIVELELDCGVICHIEPVSAFWMVKLRDIAREKFAYPDAAAYEVTEVRSNLGLPDLTVPATENPEYMELVKIADTQRNQFVRDWVFENCVSFPEGQESIEARFVKRLKSVRKAWQNSDVSDWDLLKEFILFTPSEYVTIFNVATYQQPLTEVEIRDAMRLFRPTISEA